MNELFKVFGLSLVFSGLIVISAEQTEPVATGNKAQEVRSVTYDEALLDDDNMYAEFKKT